MVWCSGGFGDGLCVCVIWRVPTLGVMGSLTPDITATQTHVPQVDTFNIYDGAAAHLLKGDISQEELTQVGWCGGGM